MDPVTPEVANAAIDWIRISEIWGPILGAVIIAIVSLWFGRKGEVERRQHERAAENDRRTHEREMDEARWDREERTRFHGLRVTVYPKFIEAAMNFGAAVSTQAEGAKVPPDYLSDKLNALSEAVLSVQLVGSEEVSRIAREWFHEIKTSIGDKRPIDANKVGEIHGRLISAMRQELGTAE